MEHLPVSSYNSPGDVNSQNRDEQHSTEHSRVLWPISSNKAIREYMTYIHVPVCQRMPFDANAVNPNAPGASCTR
jgi:hypothetical protein